MGGTIVHDPGPLEAVEKRNDELEAMVFALGTLLGEVLEHGQALPSQRRDWSDRLRRILEADGDWKPIERISMAAKLLGPMARGCGVSINLCAALDGQEVPAWSDLPTIGSTEGFQHKEYPDGEPYSVIRVHTEDDVEVCGQGPRRGA